MPKDNWTAMHRELDPDNCHINITTMHRYMLMYFTEPEHLLRPRSPTVMRMGDATMPIV